eukprot:593974-Rhodomonas_salina.1
MTGGVLRQALAFSFPLSVFQIQAILPALLPCLLLLLMPSSFPCLPEPRTTSRNASIRTNPRPRPAAPYPGTSLSSTASAEEFNQHTVTDSVSQPVRQSVINGEKGKFTLDVCVRL